jgi:hypothetical protein
LTRTPRPVPVANPPADFDMGAALERSRALKSFVDNYGGLAAALEPWATADDIGPLIRFIKSGEPLTAKMRRDIAGLIEILHQDTRPQGRPAGKQLLYRNPNYWAAYIARGLIAGWKAETGNQRIPNGIKESLVAEAIERVRSWKVAQEFKRRFTTEKVLNILRKSQKRSF